MDTTLKTLENALNILELFAYGNPSLSLADIRQQTGLHKSTVYRCVSVLSKRGYLEKDMTSNKYRLGLGIIHLASSRIDMLELQAESRPFLLRIQAKVNCSVHLCVLDRTDIIFLDIIDNFSVRSSSVAGSHRTPAYCSSGGKCLLSSLSGEIIDTLYENYEFVRYTDTTITSLQELKLALKTIRPQGFAINRGEMEPQTGSIAVPVFDYTGNAIASVGAGMHMDRMDEAMIHKILPYLKQTATNISKSLGYI